MGGVAVDWCRILAAVFRVRWCLLTADYYPGIRIILKELECSGFGVVVCWSVGFVCIQLLFVLVTQLQGQEMPSVECLVIGSHEVKWLDLRFFRCS